MTAVWDSEVEHRIKAAYSAFGRLLHRVFINHNLTIPTKAVCVSVLLYGCEGWTCYWRHIKASVLVLGIRWWQKVPHREMLSKAAITPVEHLLVHRLGHVIRMPSNRLPRRLFHGKLSEGQRPANWPKKRFMDHVKAILLRCSIDLSDLEAAATEMSGGFNYLPV